MGVVGAGAVATTPLDGVPLGRKDEVDEEDRYHQEFLAEMRRKQREAEDARIRELAERQKKQEREEKLRRMEEGGSGEKKGRCLYFFELQCHNRIHTSLPSCRFLFRR